MKKFVFKLDVPDDKEKRKAMKTVSALPGIDEISIDIKGKKLTIIGTVDPVTVVSKLRKYWRAEIILVGPAKEPEKKEEPKKEEAKKEEPKKEEGKEEPKKEEAKKELKKEEEKKAEPAPATAPAPAPAPAPAQAQASAPVPEPFVTPVMQYRPPYVGTVMPYRPYYQPMQTYYYVNHSMEENPNACVIC